MDDYTNYCTPEQTERAYKLGAPIKTTEYSAEYISKFPNVTSERSLKIYGLTILSQFDGNKMTLGIIPTTQQMFNWMRYRGFRFYITDATDISISIWKRVSNKNIDDCFVDIVGDHCEIQDFYKAELKTIDAVLTYLEKEKQNDSRSS